MPLTMRASNGRVSSTFSRCINRLPARRRTGASGHLPKIGKNARTGVRPALPNGRAVGCRFGALHAARADHMQSAQLFDALHIFKVLEKELDFAFVQAVLIGVNFEESLAAFFEQHIERIFITGAAQTRLTAEMTSSAISPPA